MTLSVHSSVASGSIVSEGTHCKCLTVRHCNTLTLCVHMPWGWCMCTHIFLSLYTVSSYGRANHCSICLCVVCSYLTRKGNADIQHSLLMFKTKICYYWSWNTSCRQPFFVTLPVEVIYCTKYLLSIYIRSAPNPSFDFRFYIDVCPLKSNCHACIFCVLYGVFELFINKIIFYLKDMFVWGTKGSFELMRVCFVFCFFPVCGRTCVCACQTKKLHIFKAF